MYQRAVLAAGGATLTDTLHLALAVVSALAMFVFIGFGAAAFSKGSRLYSIAAILVLLAFGTLTGRDGPRVAVNLPTPRVGVWERINIFAYLLWIVVLAVILLRAQMSTAAQRVQTRTALLRRLHETSS